jgi:LPXTG-motif cell wall-anchored protein
LLTATAAGTLLGALWFVPSAKATDDLPAQHRTRTATTTVVRTAAHTSSGTSEVSQASARSATGTTTTETDSTPAGRHTGLADTGSFDTTPYVAGGTLFLGLGAGFVVFSIRRERMAGY